MVLSSILNHGSRLLRSPAVLNAAACRGTFRGQQAQRASPCAAAPAAWTTVRAVGVHHRTFWDWSKGGDQGSSKGSGGAADGGGGGGSGSGIPRNGKGKPGGSNGVGEAAAEEQPPSPGSGGAAASSPMLVGSGDQAPRPSRLVGLPIKWRPLFPTTAYTYTITNPDVLTAVAKSSRSGFPYVAVFLRKESEWNQGAEADSEASGETAAAGPPEDASTAAGDNKDDVVEGAAENAVQQTFPEVITSIDEIHAVGTLAQANHVADIRPSALPGEVQLLLVGHRRLSIKEVVSLGPPLEVEVDHWNTGEFDADSEVIRAYCQEILSTVQEVVVLNPLLRERITFFSERNINVHNPFKLADLAATLSSGSPDKLQAVLTEQNPEQRLRLALDIISKEREVLRLQQDIKQQVDQKMTNQKRTYFLQEQLKSIKKELGLEKDDKEAILNKFRDRRKKIKEITKEAEKAIEEELEKLSSLEKNSPEFNGTKSYLDWLTQLPWGHASVDNFDLKKAKEGLDEDHYGLDDIKERILEFIAVGKLRGGVHGRILCFVGPPGVGKTSIGHSIAKALDREFYRFSVGGLRDVAEIKGHRRTYVGSMPGKLIQCLKVTGTNNPVVLIDEIDKLARAHDGDPASALLEVLDPSQNSAFLDNYLDVPVDLSNCLFICTANVLDTIPGPLKDRMEVIRLSGYDLPEKVAISEQYLIPKARKDHGMDKDNRLGHVEIEREAIETLARWYAREAGVRNLSKLVDKIHRKLALEMVLEDQEATAAAAAASEEEEEEEEEEVSTTSSRKGGDGKAAGLVVGEAGSPIVEEGVVADNAAAVVPEKDGERERVAGTEPKAWVVTKENLDKYVGKPTFTSDRLYEGASAPPGVVMGLAWTAMGGSSLYVEAMAIRPPTDASALLSSGVGGEGAGSGSGSAGGRLRTTGQLGDVMNESAQIAYSVARECLGKLRPASALFFEKAAEVHMHVPEGATPKDGPSAGVTMVTALLSLATGTSVREDLAMTGELSLTGKVLPVGGIKEKTIAARRAGVQCLVFPQGNKRDFEELPEYLKDGLEASPLCQRIQRRVRCCFRKESGGG
ncbi:unnamed protein product [Ectocarpus sp. CCAP 1310/34]|nr:unnamed protein product [Ectocarpus sp. CCAP 1310/34]